MQGSGRFAHHRPLQSLPITLTTQTRYPAVMNFLDILIPIYKYAEKKKKHLYHHHHHPLVRFDCSIAQHRTTAPQQISIFPLYIGVWALRMVIEKFNED